MFKKYIADLLGYIGVGFIAGAVSHGFFSGIRSIIMATLGILIFVLHQYLKENTNKDYMSIVVFGLLYSIAIGMVSGGLQHFLDSPMRSIWIIPTGFFLSYLMYCYHMKSITRQKNLNIALIGAILLGGISYATFTFMPKTWYSGMDRHHNEDSSMQQQMNCKEGGCEKCSKGDMKCAMQQSNQEMIMGMMNHGDVVSEEQFIRDMIPHHQEAVDTSKEIIARSTNNELKDVAEDIVEAQTKEIAMMQERLQDWYPNSTGVTTYKSMMPNLAIVSGSSLDILYLQGMVMHHQGAIAMANGVFNVKPREEVMDFANDIIELQSSEVVEMQTMLQKIMPGMKGGMMNHKMMGH